MFVFVSVCKNKKKLEKMKGGRGKKLGEKGELENYWDFCFSLRRVKNCKGTRVEC